MDDQGNQVLDTWLTDCVCPFCRRRFRDYWPTHVKPLYERHRIVVPCRKCLPDDPTVKKGSINEYERRKAEALRRVQAND